MVKTANGFVCEEPEIKEQAETELEKLGIPMSNAGGRFLCQMIRQREDSSESGEEDIKTGLEHSPIR